MVQLYSLSIECGSRESAEQVSDSVKPVPFIECVNYPDQESNWWSVITIDSDLGYYELQLNIILYHILHSIPYVYRYALVGLEVDEFKKYNELIEEKDIKSFKGLVVNNSLKDLLHINNEEWQVFNEDYVWLPFSNCEVTPPP